MVVAQVTGSLFLLVCASQLFRGITFLLNAPPGFRPTHILMASFNPGLARYTDDQARQFYKHLVERAQQLPGAQSASIMELVPIANHPDQRLIAPEGYDLGKGADAIDIFSNVVSEQYFSTLDIPILAGRTFRSPIRHRRRKSPLPTSASRKILPRPEPDRKALSPRRTQRRLGRNRRARQDE